MIIFKKVLRDPANELLKAYYNVLNGSIMYQGSAVVVGTKIPRRTSNYILLNIEDIDNISTGEDHLYNVIVGLQIVSKQGTTEGDIEVVNSIFEQVIELIGDPEMLIMTNFRCEQCFFVSSEPLDEQTDANYIITRKLRMSNFIEQI